MTRRQLLSNSRNVDTIVIFETERSRKGTTPMTARQFVQERRKAMTKIVASRVKKVEFPLHHWCRRFLSPGTHGRQHFCGHVGGL